MRTHVERYGAWLAAVAMALACGGTNDPEPGGSPGSTASQSSYRRAHYTVGGTISGLSGTVVLQDNDTDDLSLSTDGPFAFATALKNQSTYAVTVRAQPPGQTCVVANGSGTICDANVTNVTVSCSPSCSSSRYTVGGTITGLSGTIVLQDDGGDDLGLSADGSFTFSTTLADCSDYSVTVLAQPSGQTCTVASGSGTIAGANVTSVAVSCQASSATGQVATPMLSPCCDLTYYVDAWGYVDVYYVTLSDDTPGAAIYYTLDGSDPTFDSSGTPAGSTQVYTAGQHIDLLYYWYFTNPLTIKAIAIVDGIRSDIASGTYTMIWVF